MTDTATTSAPNVERAPADADAGKPRIDWEDPSVPPGDSPPLPRWPLYAGIAGWVLWFVFLLIMMIVRIQTTPI